MVDLLRRTNLQLDRFIPLVHRHREDIACGKGAVHQPPALVELRPTTPEGTLSWGACGSPSPLRDKPPPPRLAGERLRFAKAPAENAF